MARVLVIDDEPAIRRMLQTVLAAYGHEVAVAGDGGVALTTTAGWQPDVLILDLGLPGADGISVIQRVRAWSRVPIIVLTVRDAEHDKVAALDAGADDYVTKPFGMEELLARLRVALRNAASRGAADQPSLEFGALRIDRARRLVWVAGQEVKLTPTEYQLLSLLARSAGKVVTHQQLLREIWGPGAIDDTPLLRVFVAQLRRKLDVTERAATLIRNEPGIGYRLWLAHDSDESRDA